MGIQNDAGELLKYVYDNYISGEIVTGQSFKTESGWDDAKIGNALSYLMDRGLIKAHRYLGGDNSHFSIDGLTPEGIDIIENETKFKSTFGLGINLGLANCSWKIKEK